jgi:hypothetical protein
MCALFVLWAADLDAHCFRGLVSACVNRLLQVVKRLSGDVPVFITADEWEITAEELDDRFIGDAEIW